MVEEVYFCIKFPQLSVIVSLKSLSLSSNENFPLPSFTIIIEWKFATEKDEPS